MDVKPVNGIQNYPVNTATENVDQDRRRDRQNHDDRGHARPALPTPAVATPNPTPENKIEPEENELTRQPVDSETMVELLGQSAPIPKGSSNPFKAVQALGHPDPDKAVNRKF